MRVEAEIGAIPDLGVDQRRLQRGEMPEGPGDGRAGVVGILLDLREAGADVLVSPWLARALNALKLLLQLLVVHHPAARVDVDGGAQAVHQVLVQHAGALGDGAAGHRFGGLAGLPDLGIVGEVNQVVREADLLQPGDIAAPPHQHRHLIRQRARYDRDRELLLRAVLAPVRDRRGRHGDRIAIRTQGGIHGNGHHLLLVGGQVRQGDPSRVSTEDDLHLAVGERLAGVVAHGERERRALLHAHERSAPGPRGHLQGSREERYHAIAEAHLRQVARKTGVRAPIAVAQHQVIVAGSDRAAALMDRLARGLAIDEEAAGAGAVVGERHVDPFSRIHFKGIGGVGRRILAIAQVSEHAPLLLPRACQTEAIVPVCPGVIAGVVEVLLIDGEDVRCLLHLRLCGKPRLQGERAGGR